MDMNQSAQNALLKVMEEPPAYAAFLLLSDGEEKLLPTIRSRCVTLRLSPLDERTCITALHGAFPEKDERVLRAAALRAGGYLGQAKRLLEQEQPLLPQTLDFARCFAARDRLGLTMLLVPMEKLKRDQILPILTQWAELLAQAMTVREGMPPLHKAAAVLGRARRAGAMLKACQALRRSMELVQGNIGVGAVCGALQVWLDIPD
jgi:DNA polymerase-3 subunit delta'